MNRCFMVRYYQRAAAGKSGDQHMRYEQSNEWGYGSRPGDIDSGTSARGGSDDARQPLGRVLADGGVAWTDLTGFQRDLLKSIRYCTGEGATPTGQVVKRHLESQYGDDINNGRLYQNLNYLVDCGLLDKGFVDGRTNTYRLSEQTVAMLDETAIRLADICEFELVGSTAQTDVTVVR